jgi:hypothetical protein
MTFRANARARHHADRSHEPSIIGSPPTTTAAT